MDILLLQVKERGNKMLSGGELKPILLDIGKTFAGIQTASFLQKIGITKETAESLAARIVRRPLPTPPPPSPGYIERVTESPWTTPVLIGGVALVGLGVFFFMRRK